MNIGQELIDWIDEKQTYAHAAINDQIRSVAGATMGCMNPDERTKLSSTPVRGEGDEPNQMVVCHFDVERDTYRFVRIVADMDRCVVPISPAVLDTIPPSVLEPRIRRILGILGDTPVACGVQGDVGYFGRSADIHVFLAPTGMPYRFNPDILDLYGGTFVGAPEQQREISTQARQFKETMEEAKPSLDALAENLAHDIDDWLIDNYPNSGGDVVLKLKTALTDDEMRKVAEALRRGGALRPNDALAFSKRLDGGVDAVRIPKENIRYTWDVASGMIEADDVAHAEPEEQTEIDPNYGRKSPMEYHLLDNHEKWYWLLTENARDRGLADFLAARWPEPKVRLKKSDPDFDEIVTKLFSNSTRERYTRLNKLCPRCGDLVYFHHGSDVLFCRNWDCDYEKEPA